MRSLTGPWADWIPAERRAAVTIGVLDGVHRGHRALIDGLNGGLIPTVLTFDPHPVEVLRPGTPPRLITTIDERIELLESAGVEQVGVLDLHDIKDLDPAAFVVDVLIDKLDVGKVVVGRDFRFGKDRAGDIGLLEEMGADLDFKVDVIELVGDEGGVVSSSRIREMIESGEVALAADALTTRFRLTNKVIDGDGRGREFGFPTANLAPVERKVVPATGVYAAFARVRGDVHGAAVNVGVRPTFGGGELTIEAFLLEFDGDIYGEELTVEFVDYLRPEVEFDEVDALIEAIREDVARSRNILGATTSNMS